MNNKQMFYTIGLTAVITASLVTGIICKLEYGSWKDFRTQLPYILENRTKN